MDHALASCPRCARHVRARESRCPFCEASIEAPTHRAHFAAAAAVAAVFLHPAEGLPKELPSERIQMAAAGIEPSMPELGPIGPGFPPGSTGPGGPPRIRYRDPSNARGTVVVSLLQMERGPESAVGPVFMRLQQVLPGFRACFQRVLRVNPAYQATLRVGVETDRQGRVRSAMVLSTARRDVFESCALQSLRRVVFFPPHNDVAFTFVLRARP